MKQQVSFKSINSCFTLLIGLAIFLSSCEHLDRLPAPDKSPGQEKVRTFYGPATPLKQGVARAWVSVDKDGNPLSVGVNVSERAVQALLEESEEAHENEESHEDHVVFTLKLPKQAERTLYDHFTLDWNPHGHPPQGTYTLPHFDLHAYMISEEERKAIEFLPPLDENGNPQFDERPAPCFIPEDYILAPGIEANMGAHWVDSEAPELHGEAFTQTFIYGSYNAEFTFHEPMFTVAYLNELKGKTHPFESFEIKQPECYQKTGYYPMEYSFRYNPAPGEYTISLDKLMLKHETNL